MPAIKRRMRNGKKMKLETKRPEIDSRITIGFPFSQKIKVKLLQKPSVPVGQNPQNPKTQKKMTTRSRWSRFMNHLSCSIHGLFYLENSTHFIGKSKQYYIFFTLKYHYWHFRRSISHTIPKIPGSGSHPYFFILSAKSGCRSWIYRNKIAHTKFLKKRNEYGSSWTIFIDWLLVEKLLWVKSASDFKVTQLLFSIYAMTSLRLFIVFSSKTFLVETEKLEDIDDYIVFSSF